MKRSWWLYALLLALALAAGLAAPESSGDSPVPSVHNAGPRGTKLLRRWLEQTGRDVRVDDSTAETIVLAAPQGHAVSNRELEQLQAFVNAGGTLVYLRPRRSNAQPELDAWLQLKSAPGPQRAPRPDDLLGATVEVTHLPGVKKLRVLADEGLMTELPGAVPLASTLWYAPVGTGHVFLAAGPDLAEAARLELDDNAAFWAQLPGPVSFDELHQAPKAKPNLSANLLAALAQLGFAALAFLLVFAPRLGPARPTPKVVHRSSLEYVKSLAALTREARVEPELAKELCARLQRLLDVPDSEMPVKPGQVRTPQEFLELSRRCAALEANLPTRS